MDHFRREPWRVPDRVFWGLAVVVAVLTWSVLIWMYPSLPARIPTHFGWSGLPDAYHTKTVWTVFLPGLCQLGLMGLLIWAYRHPEYSHLPTSLTLKLIPEPWQQRITMLVRHLLVMVTVVVNLILAYLTLLTITTSFGQLVGPSPWWIIGLTGFLVALIIVYTVWLARWIRQAKRSLPTTGQ